MTQFSDDHCAFYYGYRDGRNYAAYDHQSLSLSPDGIEDYRRGYAKAMDTGLELEGGITPLENRPAEDQAYYSYYSQP